VVSPWEYHIFDEANILADCACCGIGKCNHVKSWKSNNIIFHRINAKVISGAREPDGEGVVVSNITPDPA